MRAFWVVSFALLAATTSWAGTPPRIPIGHAAIDWLPDREMFTGSEWSILTSHSSQLDGLFTGHGYTWDVCHDANSFLALHQEMLLGRGFILLRSHGASGELGVEFYTSEPDADDAVAWLTDYYDEPAFSKRRQKDPPVGWVVAVETYLMEELFDVSDGEPIVFVGACNSALGSDPVTDAFLNNGAPLVFGYNDLCTGAEDSYAARSIYGMMLGTTDRGYPPGDPYNVPAELALNYYQQAYPEHDTKTNWSTLALRPLEPTTHPGSLGSRSPTDTPRRGTTTTCTSSTTTRTLLLLPTRIASTTRGICQEDVPL